MSDGNKLVLPDSRTRDRTLGSRVMDWALPGGGVVRCEAAMVYCANCGKEFGWVPLENTVCCTYLCRRCWETHGHLLGAYVQSDEEFCQAVAQEMMDRYGKPLTADEIARETERGGLGAALEALTRESPYPSHERRSAQ